jgi:hypothetical protein
VLAALALAGGAAGHGPGPIGTGYIARVDYVEPGVLGLDARIVGGDQLRIANLTRKPVEILDREGRPFIRFRPEGVHRFSSGEWRRMTTGTSYAWHDDRVVGHGDPPPAAAGQPKTAPRFVRSWRVPGRANGRAFTIEGRLAWIPPPESADEGPSPFLLAGGAFALVALSVVAAYLLGRSRPS